MARTSHADSPFARFLAKHGYQSPSGLGIFHNIGARLLREPGRVSPNSPMLAPFAAFLKVPVKALQHFCEAAPMSAQFERKIRLQMERGTIPHGRATADKGGRPKGSKSKPKAPPASDGEQEVLFDARDNPKGPLDAKANATPFLRLALSKGFTLQKIADAVPANINMVWRLSCGDFSPNHPLVPLVADVLKVPLADLTALTKRPPMNENYIARAQAALDQAKDAPAKVRRKRGRPKKDKPGKAVVLVATPANGNGHTNGNGHGGARAGGVHNRLRSTRTSLGLRQSARAMVATLNISIMKGDTHMPPLPVGDLYLVLQDYLHEKGVKANVLIDPGFAMVFDPK